MGQGAAAFQEDQSNARVKNGTVIAFQGGFNVFRLCRYGPMVYNEFDAYVGRSFEQYGEYNQDECNILLELVESHTFVIEVGANIGSHTVPLAQKAGLVFAFEPQRLVYQTLCANLALNQLTNVHAWQAAISDEQGGCLFMPALDPREKYNFGGVSMQEEPTTEACARLTLDSLAIPRCGLLKIDVEGMELQVLKGAQKLIDEHRPFIYVENDRRDKSAALIGHLQALGYTLYWHLPPLFNADNFAKNKNNVFGNIVSVNMLCLPKPDMGDYGLRRVKGPDDIWN